MKNVMTTVLSLLGAFLIVVSFPAASEEQYEALKGVTSAKAVFDVRIASPQSAALHLKLIHQAHKDLAAAKKRPDFRVVFMGPAVKLISKDREGFKPEDNQALDEIAAAVSAMSKDGIRLEMCLVAARLMKVDPATALPEITRVENGWISLIGYQGKDFSLVPAY